MLTQAEMAWASEHDWFVGYTADNQGIIVADRWSENGEMHEYILPWLLSFHELREWAGY